MVKVLYKNLDTDYLEEKLIDLKRMLWSAINFTQWWEKMNEECDFGIEEQNQKMAAFNDEKTEAECTHQIKLLEYQKDENERKAREQLRNVVYFQDRIEQLQALIEAWDDFEASI